MRKTTKEQLRAIIAELRKAPRGQGCIHTFKVSDDELGVLLRAIRSYAKDKP